MGYDEWIEYGFEQGFCSPPVCATHDGIPTSRVEDEEADDGIDGCWWVVRLYDDAAHRKAIEENIFTVTYRLTELGWKATQ
jgi:hypothetical protein